MIDYPTKQHLKEWEIYRLWLLDLIKKETNPLKRSYFQYRLKVIESLQRLKK